MAEPVQRVETLFLHERGDEFLVAVLNDGDRVLRAILEVTETDAGPRPARFRVRRGASEDRRPPDQFVEIARRADRIRLSEQTSPARRRVVTALFEGYQLAEKVKAVRTCPYCARNARYTPLTDDTAIAAGEQSLCPACAREELDRELAYRGDLTGAARRRLEDLLLEVGDLERITNLLSGELDPDLTRVDTISATTEAVDPMAVSTLDLHPDAAALFSDRFETLLPVQTLSVEGGLLDGTDQLVVSATATGKTLIGELAGIDRLCRGGGRLLFLVPLVALANQTYEDLEAAYGDRFDVTIRVGASRVRGDGATFDPDADIIVGTYEGIDHALRTGRDLGDVGTVVIDEVHTLQDADRGHRLDGLIARLHHYCAARAADRSGYDGAHWLYLSATVGNPEWLARRLDATLVEFEDRPVPIERHVTFATHREKRDIIDRLVTREYDHSSSKGYRGQTIVFTNSRRRCHELARSIDAGAAAYHAGLDYRARKRIEGRFADQDLAAVVTTAALAAGVDFPASQVVFDALAMGIEWLSVQEFEQMLGRAGRPDYHDRGQVWLLVEPDGTYHGSMDRTEDEVAFTLLEGAMEDVETTYDEAAAIEETLANIVVAGQGAKRLNDRMVGTVPTEHAVAKLLEYGFIDGIEPTPLGRVVTRHFLAPGTTTTLREGIRSGLDPYALVADVELQDED
ncbi:MAG: DEAD/DEAH box helicase [Halobacteriaceae archaeon]